MLPQGTMCPGQGENNTGGECPPGLNEESVTLEPVEDLQFEFRELVGFLSENGFIDDTTKVNTSHQPVSDSVQTAVNPHSINMPCQEVSVNTLAGSQSSDKSGHNWNVAPSISCSVSYEMNDTDAAWATLPGQGKFDPSKQPLSADELRPQPIAKKSKVIQTRDEMKDEQYWNRRQKNNMAAKRSRDARRIKENQIAMRAAFLENQNTQLKIQLQAATEELEILKAKLTKYEVPHTYS